MRAVKIVIFLLGGLLFGFLAANNVYRAYLRFQVDPESAAVLLPSTIVWTGLLVIASLVCTVRALLVGESGQLVADAEAPIRPRWRDEGAEQEPRTPQPGERNDPLA